MAEIASNPSATADATLVLTSWWLGDPADPTPAAQVDLEVTAEALVLSSPTPAGRFRPLGEPLEVVVEDAIAGETFTLSTMLSTDARYAAFEALRRRQTTLLLRGPRGDLLYLRMAGQRDTSRLSGLARRQVQVPATEQARP